MRKEVKMIKKNQYYMTYLAQMYDDKSIGNIQFTHKGRLSKSKINDVILQIKRETQSEKVVILNIIKI